jgi:NADPH-dependent curcumin reductase CurA
MKRIVLATVPEGIPKESDFRMEEVPDADCPPGGLLVRTRWISVDPYLRGLMSGRRTYMAGFRVDEVITSGCVGEVISSRSDGFQPGQMVTGRWGWQDVAVVTDEVVRPLMPEHDPESTALGILGMPGMTAYFGLLELCQPKAGEAVVVSGAAGAVGSYVGQIAKIQGCRVVGTAGSEEKCAWLRAIGFDAAINYKAAGLFPSLKRACPNGIDCYFDNVGGEITDTVLRQMNDYGRVAVCGQIALYNESSNETGPRPFSTILVKQLRVEGFLVMRWASRWPEGIIRMRQWMNEGKLQNRETVYEGLANVPHAFIGLFRGDNTGKAIVRI